MSNLTETLIAQRESGLITDRECRASLRRLSKQAQFNADYSDSLDSYKRWSGEAVAASRAAGTPRRMARGDAGNWTQADRLAYAGSSF